METHALTDVSRVHQTDRLTEQLDMCLSKQRETVDSSHMSGLQYLAVLKLITITDGFNNQNNVLLGVTHHIFIRKTLPQQRQYPTKRMSSLTCTFILHTHSFYCTSKKYYYIIIKLCHLRNTKNNVSFRQLFYTYWLMTPIRILTYPHLLSLFVNIMSP